MFPYDQLYLQEAYQIEDLGDLNIIWETAESSDDDFWKDQEEWEIIRWRFHESSGVHTLEIEDGTMIHMLAERRYPLSRELMIRMLEHGMEVEDESETAITLIHLFILWTTEDEDDEDAAFMYCIVWKGGGTWVLGKDEDDKEFWLIVVWKGGRTWVLGRDNDDKEFGLIWKGGRTWVLGREDDDRVLVNSSLERRPNRGVMEK
ncbi:hypothetical protein Tco_0990789 [Tanacetum coccineum]|uniref:Uncharacterized protein n=1 Tax=Tanacetum coccineum TaxID=301880 RepID=A0ABQ5EXQ2_9ASTR